ncbi:hypothetical protein EVAR_96075_1 [Eumeta japonica]|uniref:Uncharacterized protein n=1 Tax=Eumeta variegata TaxID=151549 RepID=A0A4C1W6Y2_EUMVA|nr:hypothetical protein EVAR_96075_1 [Eumeta japonica]
MKLEQEVEKKQPELINKKSVVFHHDRIQLERTSQEKCKNTYKTPHNCWGRKRMKAAEQINDGANTPATGVTEAMQMDHVIASISRLDCVDIDSVRIPIIKNTFSSSSSI